MKMVVNCTLIIFSLISFVSFAAEAEGSGPVRVARTPRQAEGFYLRNNILSPRARQNLSESPPGSPVLESSLARLSPASRTSEDSLELSHSEPMSEPMIETDIVKLLDFDSWRKSGYRKMLRTIQHTIATGAKLDVNTRVPYLYCTALMWLLIHDNPYQRDMVDSLLQQDIEIDTDARNRLYMSIWDCCDAANLPLQELLKNKGIRPQPIHWEENGGRRVALSELVKPRNSSLEEARTLTTAQLELSFKCTKLSVEGTCPSNFLAHEGRRLLLRLRLYDESSTPDLSAGLYTQIIRDTPFTYHAVYENNVTSS